ncbi:MAG: SAF domain-containing protein [Paludibaculum sp.]
MERPARTFSAQEVQQALRAALPPEAQLDLVDFCRLPMPSGELSFDLNSLVSSSSQTTGGASLWRGRVKYDDRRSAPFWARVRVSIQRDGYYAASDLAAGHVIARADIVGVSRFRSSLHPAPVTDELTLIGFECRRAIPAGTPLRRTRYASTSSYSWRFDPGHC